MSTIHELERAVSDLPPEELSRFRAWFLDFDAQVWDEQIESDVAAGRLRAFADEARAELRAGRARPL
jgi:cobalamin biosynthesis protein CobT